jgi:hypothetical protein
LLTGFSLLLHDLGLLLGFGSLLLHGQSRLLLLGFSLVLHIQQETENVVCVAGQYDIYCLLLLKVSEQLLGHVCLLPIVQTAPPQNLFLFCVSSLGLFVLPLFPVCC